MTARLWGAWTDYQGNTSATQSYFGQAIAGSPLATFEASAGKKVSVPHWGAQWLANGVPRSFASSMQTGLNNAWADKRVCMVDWFNWDLQNHLNDQAINLQNIVAGATAAMPGGTTIDAYLTQFAIDCRNYGHPFMVRMFPEVNGDWDLPYQIGSGTGGSLTRSWPAGSGHTWTNTAQNLIDAWRHIYNIFQANGATNVAFIFCPNIAAVGSLAFSAFYPGTQYMHWLALDGYNDWERNGASAADLSWGLIFRGGGSSGYRDSYAELCALDTTGSLPVCIAETGCYAGASSVAVSGPNSYALTSADRTHRGLWYTNTLGTDIAAQTPRVTNVSWFWVNYDQQYWTADADGPAINTTGVVPSHADMVAFASAIADNSKYLAGSTIAVWPPADLTPLWTYTDSAPAITVVSPTPGSSSVAIVWDTPVNASSQVEYGLTTAYGTSTGVTDQTPMVLHHTVVLTALNPNTTYHYRIHSTDSWGNAAVGSDQTFTTAAIGADPYLTAEANVAGRVTHYRLGDASKAAGAVMADVLGTYNGNYRGTAADAASLLPATNDHAVSLDGSSYGESSNVAALSPQVGVSGKLSLSAWFKESAAPAAIETLASKASPAGYEYALRRTPTGVEADLWGLDGTTYTGAAFGLTPAANVRHRLTMVFDATLSGTAQLSLYLDGVFLANGTAPGATTLANGPAPFAIGNRGGSNAGADQFTGTVGAPVVVDEVVLRNVALTATQEAALYAAGANDTYLLAEAAIPGRVAYYRLGDASKAAGAAMADALNTYPGAYRGASADATGLVAQASDHAISVNGSSFGEVPSNPAFSPQVGPNGKLVVSAWWKESTAPSGVETLASKASGAGSGSYEYALRRTPTGLEADLWSLVGNTYTAASAGASITSNVSHRATMVFDATKSGGLQLALYLDGVLLANGQAPDPTAVMAGGSAAFAIGNRGGSDASADQFAGAVSTPVVIDEVSVRNIPLTAAQELSLYNAGAAVSAFSATDTTIVVGAESKSSSTVLVATDAGHPVGTESALQRVSPSGSDLALIASVETRVLSLSFSAVDSAVIADSTIAGTNQATRLALSDTGLATATEGASAIIQTAPVIAAVVASRISDTSMLITWTTDRPSTSQVEYGTTPVYGQLTPLDSNLVTAHSVTLNGLLPSTTYHYRVRSDG